MQEPKHIDHQEHEKVYCHDYEQMDHKAFEEAEEQATEDQVHRHGFPEEPFVTQLLIQYEHHMACKISEGEE